MHKSRQNKKTSTASNTVDRHHALTFATLAIAISLASASSRASDIACESTFLGGGLVDTRSFPTQQGRTILNGRVDGNLNDCTITPVNTASTVNYSNGLSILPDGTAIKFSNIDTYISNGLIIDNNNKSNGNVTFSSDISTKIEGPVTVRNQAHLNFLISNDRSTTTRLYLDDAYIAVDDNSSLNAEFKLGNTTGSYFSVGAISGTGDTFLTNIGKASEEAEIIINNNDGLDYQYSGDIYYENQLAPTLIKHGAGTYTFSGDVKKSSGDTLNFTDGFSSIEITDGAVETTTDAFIVGTRVQLNGGDLILNQNTNGTALGAELSGTGVLYKRGTSTVTLGNIKSNFQGVVHVEKGQLELSGDADLKLSNRLIINDGATLDISKAYTNFGFSSIYGSGTLALGSRSTGQLIRLSPGDTTSSIGVFNVTGSGSFGLSGALIGIDIDATKSASNSPGISHDQLAIESSAKFSVAPVIKLTDMQKGNTPSALLNGREFTVLTAGSGLSGLPATNIIEDTNSFHAFIGADTEKTTITDTDVTVVFGIKTINQVVSSINNTLALAKTTGTANIPSTNTSNAALQYIQQTTGLSGNQAPTITQLEQHPGLANTTTADLIRTHSNNNPEAFSSNMTIGLEYQDLISNITMNHASGSGLGLQGVDGNYQQQGRYWLDVAYVDGQVDGKRSHTGDYQYDIAGLVTGVDLIKTDVNTLGVFASIGSAKLDEHDNIQQQIDTDALNIGLYHQYSFESGIDVHSVAMGFYHDSTSTRVNLRTDSNAHPTSKSDFSAQGVTLGVMASKFIPLNGIVSVTPNLGFSYSYLSQDDINESEGGYDYDYRIDSASAETVIFGMGADTSFKLSDKKPIYLDIRARYEFDAYANSNETHDIKAGLYGQQKSKFVGQNRGEHGFILGVGIGGKVSNNMTLNGGYLYSTHSNGSESSLGGNLTYRW